MSATPSHYRGVLEISAEIRAGELSPVELTKAMLARVEALEPRLHAYYTVTRQRATAAAERAEREIGAGRWLGPLHGVPIGVKDLCFTAGIRTTGGSGVRRDFVPSYDATVVARLEAAGAVLLGKLATTEGAMAGYHPDFEVPRNPWGEALWPGVSSGGSGVATAAGLCFASLGTDTGGSIRYPSAMNGIVGLKPTWGRVSRHGVLDLAPSLDHVGPMTRRVADAAAVLRAIAGPDPGDPTALPDAVPDYLAELDRGAAGLRIGYDQRYATEGVAPPLASAIRTALDVLEKHGARIVEIALPAEALDQDALLAWQTLCAAEAAAVHHETYPSRAGEYGNWFRFWLGFGASTTGAQYAAAHRRRLETSGAIRNAMRDVDLLACPAVASEPFPYRLAGVFEAPDPSGDSSAGVPLEWFQRSSRFTIPWDYNGYPTLTLPCGATVEGLPLSLQLAGHPLTEGILLRAGHAYESATEWHRRQPPV
ncbi:MAG TPA: amidase [Thermoanaerobaculia bacterium]|nr:amidase [Thermoanaerobaculia bacterium]